MRKWPLTLITMQSAGAALASSSTATSLLRAEAKKRLDAGFFYSTGLKIQVKAQGKITTVTTPGTLTMDIRFRGAPDSASPTTVIVATGPAMVLSTSAKTDVLWLLDWELTCFAIGTTANLQHGGGWESEAAGATTVAQEMKKINLSATVPGVGSNFDATQIQEVDLFAKFSTGVANSITCQQFELISKN